MRMTEKGPNGYFIPAERGTFVVEVDRYGKIEGTRFTGTVVDRLGVYEECGIEPEEVQLIKRALFSALADLHGKCSACAHYTANHNDGLCRFCCYEEAREPNIEANDNWTWRYKELYVHGTDD